jgi:hypothetical protein
MGGGGGGLATTLSDLGAAGRGGPDARDDASTSHGNGTHAGHGGMGEVALGGCAVHGERGASYGEGIVGLRKGALTT